ncbi:SURF1 family protein [Streptomonospora wellingtoniae]|uniref:SURF1-like protein n=1 Tax=Streptomonospora wellingtoniae TaxID=3075544 RepID=A0ABU2KZR4_9ACTN|nr:SURF1 family protein [Streptomonospora sp. DSM 45055]MDT0304791.1 SURF1 family protein [Streptomonospora sp. DSM 45055]
MRSVLVKPRWLGIHLLVLLAVTVCLGAGYWQFERAQQPSREVVDSPIERLSQARPLESVLQPGAYMSEEEGNQAVRVTGVYAPERQRLAPALSPEGEKGYYVVVPLVTGEDTAVAVSRGWLPESAADSADRPADVPEGEVSVTGWLQPPDKAEDGYIPVDTPEGHVARIAPSLLVNEWPYRLYEGYIILGEQRPGDTSAGAGPRLREIPPPEPPEGIVWNWRNVSYAAQWVVFGGAVVVFWVSLMRRELREGGSAGDQDGQGGRGPGSQDVRPDAGGGGAPSADAGGDQVSVART